MTQRIFDVENKKDMQDLWDILPDNIISGIKRMSVVGGIDTRFYNGAGENIYTSEILKINWHDKTEINRPIQECTEQDIGKLCYFWGNNKNDYAYGILRSIGTENGENYYTIDDTDGGLYFEHARRLTKKEIEELC